MVIKGICFTDEFSIPTSDSVILSKFDSKFTFLLVKTRLIVDLLPTDILFSISTPPVIANLARLSRIINIY